MVPGPDDPMRAGGPPAQVVATRPAIGPATTPPDAPAAVDAQRHRSGDPAARSALRIPIDGVATAGAAAKLRPGAWRTAVTKRSTSSRRAGRRCVPSTPASSASCSPATAAASPCISTTRSGAFCYYYAHLDRYADGLREGQPRRRRRCRGLRRDHRQRAEGHAAPALRDLPAQPSRAGGGRARPSTRTSCCGEARLSSARDAYYVLRHASTLGCSWRCCCCRRPSPRRARPAPRAGRRFAACSPPASATARSCPTMGPGRGHEHQVAHAAARAGPLQPHRLGRPRVRDDGRQHRCQRDVSQGPVRRR